MNTLLSGVKNSMKPFVSIIIPTLNEEMYLEPTLKAIKSQIYNGQYEIIVSDGGSKDRTLEIAGKYADKIIRAKKKGIGAGRNAGAGEAKGEIIFFIDADTILIYNTLDEIVNAFEDKEIAGVAVPLLPISTKTGDVIIFLAVNGFVKLNAERGKGHARVVGSCCAYRKSVFDEVGGFDEAIGALEDFNLSERISNLGKIKYVEKTMALVSTMRIARWGKIKSVKNYTSLYLKHLLREKGLSQFSIKGEDYRPIR